MKTPGKEGFAALQVGAGSRKAKQATAPLAGHYRAAGVDIKRTAAEFRVSVCALLPVGTPLCAAHFAAGQKVDVAGTTRGKGFAGAMKRHGFAGQGASHGNSVSHRAIGSTGCRQDPGRVFKGKKMPGHMGNVRRTAQSLTVWRVDPARGLLYIKGAVPGGAGGWVEVTDAVRERRPGMEVPLQEGVPFPTWVEAAMGARDTLPVSDAPRQAVNPFEVVQPLRNVKGGGA